MIICGCWRGENWKMQFYKILSNSFDFVNILVIVRNRVLLLLVEKSFSGKSICTWTELTVSRTSVSRQTISRADINKNTYSFTHSIAIELKENHLNCLFINTIAALH